MHATRNITIRVDEALLGEARLLAAAEETSVSRFLARLLEERIRQGKAYERARRRALARLRRGYDLHFERPATRDELHER